MQLMLMSELAAAINDHVENAAVLEQSAFSAVS